MLIFKEKNTWCRTTLIFFQILYIPDSYSAIIFHQVSFEVFLVVIHNLHSNFHYISLSFAKTLQAQRRRISTKLQCDIRVTIKTTLW